ncbi:MAG: translation elongation factor Ts, partial [Brachybacterium sp.]
DEAVAAAVESGANEPEELADTSFGEALTNAGATMGEKILVRRIGRVSGEAVSSYMHRTNKDLPPQVGVLVASDKAGAEVGRDVAMHIAAFSPAYLTREEVPEEIVANERRIAEETAKNEGKPEKAITKIVEGRLKGYFKENVLLDQAFAKDPKQTVGQIVENAGGKLTGFVRFRVGG